MKKYASNPFIHGTLLLTIAGILSRILGFFYRIFLSNTIGAQGMGIYQLIFPVYGICNAVCTAPIQTAISRYAASEYSLGSKKGARDTLHAGMFLSLSLSTVFALIIWQFAGPIAVYALKEPQCEPLLVIMALSIPAGAIHTCINGYYYGLQRAAVPAFSQLSEQLVRVLSVYLLATIAMTNQLTITPSLAAYGLLIGEVASVLYCVLAISLHSSSSLRGKENPSSSTFFKQMKAILLLAAPLSLNRLMINFLQSIEAVSIPDALRIFGCSNIEALEIYGVLTGMSLHFIMFPSAITNSIAVMLLPAIADAQAANNAARIHRTSDVSIRFSITMGMLCTGIFLIFGKDMGLLFFHNSQAGDFITILAWLCPFLYLTTTLGSILNGFEKTGISFLHNLIALSIRILFILFLIPRVGIIGYLWGLLVSQLSIALLHLYSVRSLISIHFNAFAWILHPFISLVFSAFIVLFTFSFFPATLLHPIFMLMLKCLFICGIYSFFMLKVFRQ